MPKSNTKNIRHNTTSSKDSESFSLILPNQKYLSDFIFNKIMGPKPHWCQSWGRGETDLEETIVTNFLLISIFFINKYK